MAYCTSTDVASEFKNITFSASTAVTSTEVDGFIAQADAEIDGVVGLRYEVPVTGASSLLIVKQISIKLVAGRIKKILEVKTSTEEVNQEAQSPNLIAEARDMLDKIVKGTLLLSDATVLSSTGGFKSFAVDEDLDYEFDITGDNW